MPPAGKAKAGINLTQDQVDRMTKELENIDKFFNALPPEEQIEFLKQVEEAQKMINNLSEEELAQLMKDMEQLMPEVFEGLPMEALTKPISQPETLTPMNIPAPTKQEKITLTAEEEEALRCIDSIIKLINECNVKISSAPEIGHNIERWIKSGKISNWPKDKNWHYIASQLDIVIQKLTLLKYQDPVSLQYRHLKVLSEDTLLLNLLKKVEKNLLATVAYIDIPTLGIEKMKKESKSFLQKVVTTLGEAIMKDELIKKIDTLLAKFNTEADKIKSSEKKDTLRAQQQAQTKTQPGRTVVAGQSSERDDFRDRAFDRDHSFYGSESSYSPRSYEPSMQSGSRSSLASPSQKTEAAVSTPSKTSSSPSPIKSGLSVQDIDKKKKQTSFDKSIDEIVDLTMEIADMISINRQINNLDHHLKSNETIDSKTIHTLDNIQTNIENLIKQVNAFNRKINDLGELRKKYKSQLTTAFNKHKGNIVKMRTVINDLKNKTPSLSSEKRYAYFKEQITFAEGKEKPLQLGSSLADLADAITRLESIIQK
ncbi:MAG TPA: hypothetical protein VL201_00535 [Patescibacteria group bacterium]|jgi:hypothetical protein|nr:hypothetical protein [Patescibacteria group bacterium]